MIKKLCTIKPEQWKNIGTLLRPLVGQGSINIKDSKIYQDINSGVAILIADINNLIGNNINLDIMNPNKHLKLFKLLEGDKDVDILHDSDNSQFIITNNQIKIYLPEQSEKSNNILNVPDFSNITPLGGSIKLDKINKREIEIFIKAETVNSINLLVKDNSLMGFEIKETGIYLFPGYTNQTNLNSNSSDIVLKSLAFMILPGEEFEIYLGKYNNEDKYLLFTRINMGFLQMELYEDLDVGGDDSMFNLI